MYFQEEIDNYSIRLGKNANPKQLIEIQEQAITDLRDRNIVGIIIVPISFLVGGFFTNYFSDHPILFFSIGTLLALSILCRIWTVYGFSSNSFESKIKYLPLFFWSNFFVGLIWGFFTGTAIFFYYDSVSISLIIILLAGIGGGSMATYCIWQNLAYGYLLIILTPPIMAEFYIGNEVTYPIGIAIGLFLTFNLIQARHWHHNYWVSLINTFIVKNNSLEIERVNVELAQEIENHKRTSEKIRVSKKKLQDIFNNAHDAIFIYNLDGTVIDVNETALSLFGVSRKTALQYSIPRNIASKLNNEVELKAIWEKAIDGEDQEFLWSATRKNPPLLFRAQINFHKTLWSEEPVIIATVRDITMQVKANEAALAASRAKSEFIANISHEIRTPMHGVLGYASLGLKRSDHIEREKIYEYFSIIHESGQRLMGLLNNLLDFSKLDVDKMRYSMKECHLLPYIEQVAKELTPMFLEKNLYFEHQCEDESTQVYCDPDKILQVLRNLLFNAIKFSDEGKKIIIKSRKKGIENGEKKLRVSIINYGVPIPEEELQSIFGEFIQSSKTKTGAGGTGLGLAISRQILKDHNSSIWAENGKNGETLFHFTLPLKKPQLY